MIEQAAEFGGGRIDLLFNNAGAGFSGHFEEQTNGDWEKAFALNFYAAVYGIRAVLPVMRAQGGGHIVNIISGIAFYPMAYQTMYSATKAALNSSDPRPPVRVVGREHPPDIGDAGYDGHRDLGGHGSPSGLPVA